MSYATVYSTKDKSSIDFMLNSSDILEYCTAISIKELERVNRENIDSYLTALGLNGWSDFDCSCVRYALDNLDELAKFADIYYIMEGTDNDCFNGTRATLDPLILYGEEYTDAVVEGNMCDFGRTKIDGVGLFAQNYTGGADSVFEGRMYMPEYKPFTESVNLTLEDSIDVDLFDYWAMRQCELFVDYGVPIDTSHKKYDTNLTVELMREQECIDNNFDIVSLALDGESPSSDMFLAELLDINSGYVQEVYAGNSNPMLMCRLIDLDYNNGRILISGLDILDLELEEPSTKKVTIRTLEEEYLHSCPIIIERIEGKKLRVHY